MLVDIRKEEDVELDIKKAFADNLRLALSNLGIHGPDTLHGPVKVLEPSLTSGHLLHTALTLGSTDTPLGAFV